MQNLRYSPPRVAAALPAYAFEPLPAETMDDTRVFKVEVLQVTDIEPYRDALNGFLKSLQASGLVEAKTSACISPRLISTSRTAASGASSACCCVSARSPRIVEAKPDLVLTIGTPATKYARGMMADAHIPLVFTAVANPEDAGCVSLVDAGEGATGSTLYTDMTDSLKLVKDVFPSVRRIGMVHTDDENGVAKRGGGHRERQAAGTGVSARLVNKSDHIAPKLKELYAAGVEMFAVPLDTYYGLHRYEAAMDLGDFGVENKVPVVTLAMVRVPGAALYGRGFQAGRPAGRHAGGQDPQRHTKPDVLPILRQETPTVLVDRPGWKR
jgi:putative ABC transport system substrate-binding protein